MKIDFKQHISAAIFAFGFVAPITFMLMDREPPYIRNGGEIIPSDPQPGDEVEIKWDITAKKACPQSSDQSVTRQIITRSGRIVNFEPVGGVIGTQRSEEDRKSIKRTFRIPEHIEPGPARYRSTACFACNPLQHFLDIPVCVSDPEINFVIREKP